MVMLSYEQNKKTASFSGRKLQKNEKMFGFSRKRLDFSEKDAIMNIEHLFGTVVRLFGHATMNIGGTDYVYVVY